MKKTIIAAAAALLLTLSLLPAQVLAAAIGKVFPEDAVITAAAYENVQEIPLNNGEYTLDGLEEGYYKLTIKREGYVSYAVEGLYHTDDSVLPSVTLVRVGDINGTGGTSGDVDVTDLACLFDWLSTGSYNGSIEDYQYREQVCDVNCDGTVDILDYQRLYTMIMTPGPTGPDDSKTVTTVPFSGYTLKDKNFSPVTVAEDAVLTITSRPAQSVEGVRRYYPDAYQITGMPELYLCDESAADYILIQGSTMVYLSAYEAFADGVTTSATTVMYAGERCGSYEQDVVLINGKAYPLGGTETAVWGNRGVRYTPTELQPIPCKLVNSDGSLYDGAVLRFDAEGNVTEIQCAECRRPYPVFEDFSASMGERYEQVGKLVYEGKTLYIVQSTGTSSSTTTSPKTG